jgi:GH15 family glucan-1,4-alpha-glucosidase
VDVRALARRSVEVIREGQAPTGAYLACPDFAPYRYSWFRDGSFIADAMSRVGETDSAEAFFRWCSRTLLARAEEIRAGGHPHTRYTVDGEESETEWPTFQLDGFGLLLWALKGHERRGASIEEFHEVGDLLADYVARNWQLPCTDWWEEREGLHAATLGSIRAGLTTWVDAEPVGVTTAFFESIEAPRLDASLYALTLVGDDLEAPLGDGQAAILDRLDETLVSPGGGVHRHVEDTYYGGGEWLLLTAFRGLAGREPEACLDWVVAHATADGLLPEQSQDHLLAPEMFEHWVDRWGPPPCPLLWSHAMFLTLASQLGEL